MARHICAAARKLLTTPMHANTNTCTVHTRHRPHTPSPTHACTWCYQDKFREAGRGSTAMVTHKPRVQRSR